MLCAGTKKCLIITKATCFQAFALSSFRDRFKHLNPWPRPQCGSHQGGPEPRMDDESISTVYTGLSRLKLFFALSRTPHGLLDMTTPAFAHCSGSAVIHPLPSLFWESSPPFPVIPRFMPSMMWLITGLTGKRSGMGAFRILRTTWTVSWFVTRWHRVS